MIPKKLKIDDWSDQHLSTFPLCSKVATNITQKWYGRSSIMKCWRFGSRIATKFSKSTLGSKFGVKVDQNSQSSDFKIVNVIWSKGFLLQTGILDRSLPVDGWPGMTTHILLVLVLVLLVLLDVVLILLWLVMLQSVESWLIRNEVVSGNCWMVHNVWAIWSMGVCRWRLCRRYTGEAIVGIYNHSCSVLLIGWLASIETDHIKLRWLSWWERCSKCASTWLLECF